MNRILTKTEQTLYLWAVRNLVGFPEITDVAFSGAFMTKRTRPYVTLHVLTESRNGRAEILEDYDEGPPEKLSRYSVNMTTGTFRVLVIGDTPTVSCVDVAHRLVDSIGDPLDTIAMEGQGLALTGVVASPRRLLTAGDGVVSDRASVDFAFASSRCVLLAEDSDWIETVTIEGTLND